jgi:hypothetical protein
MGVRLEIGATDLVVTMTGWDVLWAFRRRFAVPLASVTSAGAVTRARTRRVRWRFRGTNFPGVIVAGLYRSRGRWEFGRARRGHAARGQGRGAAAGVTTA